MDSARSSSVVMTILAWLDIDSFPFSACDGERCWQQTVSAGLWPAGQHTRKVDPLSRSTADKDLLAQESDGIGPRLAAAHR
jgi:hypothetical protein